MLQRGVTVLSTWLTAACITYITMIIDWLFPCRHLLRAVFCHHHAEHQSPQSQCQGQAHSGEVHLHEQGNQRRRRPAAWSFNRESTPHHLPPTTVKIYKCILYLIWFYARANQLGLGIQNKIFIFMTEKEKCLFLWVSMRNNALWMSIRNVII